MWLNMLHMRLSPKNEGPKRLDRRVQTGDGLGNFFLNFSECKKSPFRLWCFVQRRKTHRCNLLSPREQTYSRFAKLSELSSDSVREFLMKKSKGTSKGTSKVSISSETPFAITSIKRTQQVVVKAHYKFTNEFGYIFS